MDLYLGVGVYSSSLLLVIHGAVIGLVSCPTAL